MFNNNNDNKETNIFINNNNKFGSKAFQNKEIKAGHNSKFHIIFQAVTKKSGYRTTPIAQVLLAEAQTATQLRPCRVAHFGFFNIYFLQSVGAGPQIMQFIFMYVLEFNAIVVAHDHHARISGQVERVAASRVVPTVAFKAGDFLAATLRITVGCDGKGADYK